MAKPGHGWDSLTWQWGCGLEQPIIAPLFSKIYGGRDAASRSQLQGPHCGLLWCPQHTKKTSHRKEEPQTRLESLRGVCSGDRGPTRNQDGPNPGCCQSTQPWPPHHHPRPPGKGEKGSPHQSQTCTQG